MNHLTAVASGQMACPRCRSQLSNDVEGYRCTRCGQAYPVRVGLADFREQSFESANQLALADLFHADWEQMTYPQMVRARFDGLRQRGLAAGRTSESLRNLDRDEEAHLGSYRTRGALHCAMLRAMLEAARCRFPAGLIVDVGCGWGRDLLHLAGLGRRAIGIDVSSYSLLLTGKLLEQERVDNVQLVLGSADALPLADASADGINCSATIEHLSDAGQFLREAYRCLKPGGWLFLYYPNRFSVLPETHTGVLGLGWLPLAWQKRVIGEHWDTTLFSRSQFTRLMASRFPSRRRRITGIPPGLEEFMQTSKFRKMLGPAVGLVRRGIGLARRLPGGDRAISAISPVHYVAAVRDDRPAQRP